MANFETPVLGCIDAKVRKQILVWIAIWFEKMIGKKGHGERLFWKLSTRSIFLNNFSRFCTVLNWKSTRQTFSHFAKIVLVFSKCWLFFATLVQNSPMFFGISAICTEKIKILDSQTPWDFATNIFEIFRKWFSKVRKG